MSDRFQQPRKELAVFVGVGREEAFIDGNLFPTFINHSDCRRRFHFQAVGQFSAFVPNHLGWKPFTLNGLTNFRQTFVNENDEDGSGNFLVNFFVALRVQSLSDAFKLSVRVWASGAHEVQNDLLVLGENLTQGDRTLAIRGDNG